MNRTATVGRMQTCLDRLGIPLTVVWKPDCQSGKHGQIDSGSLFIYDNDEIEAWSTFEHEVYEYKFKEVTYPYYALLNSLIDGIQKLVYERKEKFLVTLPLIREVLESEKSRKDQ